MFLFQSKASVSFLRLRSFTLTLAAFLLVQYAATPVAWAKCTEVGNWRYVLEGFLKAAKGTPNDYVQCANDKQKEILDRALSRNCDGLKKEQKEICDGIEKGLFAEDTSCGLRSEVEEGGKLQKTLSRATSAIANKTKSIFQGASLGVCACISGQLTESMIPRSKDSEIGSFLSGCQEALQSVPDIQSGNCLDHQESGLATLARGLSDSRGTPREDLIRARNSAFLDPALDLAIEFYKARNCEKQVDGNFRISGSGDLIKIIFREEFKNFMYAHFSFSQALKDHKEKGSSSLTCSDAAVVIKQLLASEPFLDQRDSMLKIVKDANAKKDDMLKNVKNKNKDIDKETDAALKEHTENTDAAVLKAYNEDPSPKKKRFEKVLPLLSEVTKKIGDSEPLLSLEKMGEAWGLSLQSSESPARAEKESSPNVSRKQKREQEKEQEKKNAAFSKELAEIRESGQGTPEELLNRQLEVIDRATHVSSSLRNSEENIAITNADLSNDKKREARNKSMIRAAARLKSESGGSNAPDVDYQVLASHLIRARVNEYRKELIAASETPATEKDLPRINTRTRLPRIPSESGSLKVTHSSQQTSPQEHRESDIGNEPIVPQKISRLDRAKQGLSRVVSKVRSGVNNIRESRTASKQLQMDRANAEVALRANSVHSNPTYQSRSGLEGEMPLFEREDISKGFQLYVPGTLRIYQGTQLQFQMKNGSVRHCTPEFADKEKQVSINDGNITCETGPIKVSEVTGYKVLGGRGIAPPKAQMKVQSSESDQKNRSIFEKKIDPFKNPHPFEKQNVYDVSARAQVPYNQLHFVPGKRYRLGILNHTDLKHIFKECVAQDRNTLEAADPSKVKNVVIMCNRFYGYEPKDITSFEVME